MSPLSVKTADYTQDKNLTNNFEDLKIMYNSKKNADKSPK